MSDSNVNEKTTEETLQSQEPELTEDQIDQALKDTDSIIDEFVQSLSEAGGFDPDELRSTVGKRVQNDRKILRAKQYLDEVTELTSCGDIFAALNEMNPYFEDQFKASVDHVITSTNPNAIVTFDVMRSFEAFTFMYEELKGTIKAYAPQLIQADKAMAPYVNLISAWVEKHEYLHRRIKKNFDFSKEFNRFKACFYYEVAKRHAGDVGVEMGLNDITREKLTEFAAQMLAEISKQSEEEVIPREIKVEALIEVASQIPEALKTINDEKHAEAVQAIAMFLSGFQNGTEQIQSFAEENTTVN